MITILVFLSVMFNFSEAQLKVGFYAGSCPQAESVIQQVVENEVTSKPENAAVLLRLQFHDCFVQGCDGSILLRNDDGDDETVAPGNAGVNGFGIIDNAKAALESICPGVVSCADVVVLAARDAIAMAKGPVFDVPTGRRDGRISNAKDAGNLPDPQESFETLRSKFREQGLSDQDLVLLTAGAHTIGTTACFFVTPRLDAGDPSLSRDLFKLLRSRCPTGGDVGVKVPLDWDGQFSFDDHIFRNIKSGKAVLASDSVLYQNKATRNIIDSYLNASQKPDFPADFARAMIRMRGLNVKTGALGEMRRFCNTTN